VELPDQHANIIRLRYLRGRKQTLEEVGERINLTRERVRQIEDMAMERLAKHVQTPNQNWARRGCPAVVPDASEFRTYQQHFARLED
jgi:DNA-directed RNA polymerase sigma subunit (sigma70/sigma32)